MKIFILYLLMVAVIACGKPHSHDEHDDHHEHKDADHHAEKQDHHEDAPHDEGHHDEAKPSNTGPGFAVLEADPHQGLKLSEIALKNIGVTTIPLTNEKLPTSAILFEKNERGFYRLRNGWFQFIVLNNIQLEIKNGDAIVTEGSALLRITELDVFSKTEEGHHH